MKILLSTRTDTPRVIDTLAREVGFDGIELLLPPVATYTPEYITGLTSVSAIHAPIAAYDVHEYEAALALSLSVAKDLGAQVVNIHPSALSRGGEENVAAGLRVLKRLQALNREVLICYEVLPKPLKEHHKLQQGYKRPRHWLLDVVQYIQPATLDTTHIASWGEALPDYVKRLGSYLRHIHISDYDPDTGQHLFLGEGSIDFTSFFQAVKELPHADTLCVTFEPGRRFNLLKNKDRLAASLEIIRKGIS